MILISKLNPSIFHNLLKTSKETYAGESTHYRLYKRVNNFRFVIASFQRKNRIKFTWRKSQFYLNKKLSLLKRLKRLKKRSTVHNAT
jgi:hypothetical protein